MDYIMLLKLSSPFQKVFTFLYLKIYGCVINILFLLDSGGLNTLIKRQRLSRLE